LRDSGGFTLRTKIPFVVSGFVGLAVTAAFSMPASAGQPSGTSAAPGRAGQIELTTGFPAYRVHPGESVVLDGPCGTISGGPGALVELIGTAPLTVPAYDKVPCQGDKLRPVWHTTINTDAHDGAYTMHYITTGGDYGARITVVDGVPPVTTPPTTTPPVTTPPTQSGAPTPPAKTTAPAKQSQQVPVKPKGAPQTGGGGLADVVSTWS
jgi:hypothetical protein